MLSPIDWRTQLFSQPFFLEESLYSVYFVRVWQSFKCEPENCHLFQKRLKSTFILLKKKENKQQKHFLLFLYYKTVCDKLVCSWNLPILNLNIKLSIISVVQAFTPTFQVMICQYTMLGGNELDFSLLVCLQNHDCKCIYPKESWKIINERNKASL